MVRMQIRKRSWVLKKSRYAASYYIEDHTFFKIRSLIKARLNHRYICVKTKKKRSVTSYNIVIYRNIYDS